MLLTRSPLTHVDRSPSSFDLHVLSTPPAFVLSQDQTLHQRIWCKPGKGSDRDPGCRGRHTKASTTCSFQLTGISPSAAEATWSMVMLRTRLRSSSLPFSRCCSPLARGRGEANFTGVPEVRMAGLPEALFPVGQWRFRESSCPAKCRTCLRGEEVR